MARTDLARGLLIVLLLAASGHAADRYVATSGTDSANTCLSPATPCRTMAAAHAVAVSGDTINVAGGVYSESLRTTGPTTLTFLGGWDAAFTARDPRAIRTILHGRTVSFSAVPGPDRVFTISALGSDIDVSIDGFTIERAHGTTCIGDEFCTPSIGGSLRAGGGLSALAHGAVLTLTVSNTTFVRNQVLRGSDGGGGVAIVAAEGGRVDATLDAVVVSRNRAPRVTLGGGGILAYTGLAAGFPPATVNLTLTNSIVSRNRTDGTYGGGGLLALSNDTALRVLNSTFRGNVTRQRPVLFPLGGGGAVHLRDTGSPGVIADVTNSTFWGDAAAPGGIGEEILLDGVGTTVNSDHNNIQGLVLGGGTYNDGGGNVSVKPGRTLDGHLASNSLLIDAGTCVGAPAADIDGDPRPSGAGCDIGADEFVP